LGRSGLVTAYKSAASLALEKAIRTKVIPTSLLELQFPYSRMQEIQTFLNRTGIKPIEIQMTTNVLIKLRVELSEIRNWEEFLLSLPEVIFEFYN
jgi:putative IMPACT (imprinted ancient) family translation regulator